MRKSPLLGVAVAAIVAAAMTPAAAVVTLPEPGQVVGTSKKVPASLFGMHDHSLTTTAPDAEHRFGGVRLWDNGVRWDQINTARGVYDWTVLDQVVANARATGAKDVMYVLGSTPEWAASFSRPQCGGAVYTQCSYYGPGSNSMPASMSDWTTWVRAVAERYRGRITQYQIWNEANLTSFFDGGGEDSPVAMADLTVAAEKAVRAVDPSARIATASSTVIQTSSYVKKGWFARYLTALQQRRSKPDSIAVHLYPWVAKGPGNGTLAERDQGLNLVKQVMAKSGYLGLPIQDTEMNFGNQRDNGHPKKKYSQTEGAAYLAQTYLASLHNGVAQVDWYGWDDHVLGIWLTSPSGTVLKPGVAYRTLLTNLSGARNLGCTITKSVTTCKVRKSGTVQYYVYRPTKRKVSYSVPVKWKVKKTYDVLGACKPIKQDRVRVGLSPVRLTP